MVFDHRVILPGGNGAVLELGSGGGFLSERIPGLITSECALCSGVDSILNAQTLPFKDNSLRGIVMINVLRHLPYSRDFLRESIHCLAIGGRIIMIEPWVTHWSRFIYNRLHYEPFDPGAPEWGFYSTGHLSGANSVQPWIIFQRDRRKFVQEFSELRLETIKLMIPFRYLISSDVTSRNLLPGWMHSACRLMENMIIPWIDQTAMFAFICRHSDQRRKGGNGGGKCQGNQMPRIEPCH